MHVTIYIIVEGQRSKFHRLAFISYAPQFIFKNLENLDLSGLLNSRATREGKNLINFPKNLVD
jgi:hypothetical protein